MNTKAIINCKQINLVEFYEHDSGNYIISIQFINGKERNYEFLDKNEANRLYSYLFNNINE